MRILFVAPAGNLQTMSELARIASGDEFELCDGIVDRKKLEKYLTSGTVYDVVHFCQHGEVGLLDYHDGPLEMGELVTMFKRQVALKFVVLNACNSMAIGVALHNALTVPVVTMNSPIEDEAAIRFVEALYRNIHAGNTLEVSVEAARAVLMRLHPNQAYSPQLINGNKAVIDDLVLRLEDCALTLKGDMRKLRVDLLDSFNMIEARDKQMQQTIDELQTVVKSLKLVSSLHVRRTALTLMLLVFLLLVAELLTPWLTHLLTVH